MGAARPKDPDPAGAGAKKLLDHRRWRSSMESGWFVGSRTHQPGFLRLLIPHACSDFQTPHRDKKQNRRPQGGNDENTSNAGERCNQAARDGA